MLREQLESIPPIGRMNYIKTYTCLVAHFDPLAQTYQVRKNKNQTK